MAYHTDLYTRAAGICVAAVGAAPNRRQIVTFSDVHFCCTDDPTVHMTFSVMLNEGTNVIDIVYQTMAGLGTDGSRGTVGVQNGNGTVGTPYRCGIAGSIVSGLAIQFVPM